MSAAHRGRQTPFDRKHTEVTGAGMSAAHGGRRNPHTKPLSPEHRVRISAALAGRALSDEHRAALVASHRGKTASAETWARMSASQRRRSALEASGAARPAVAEEAVGTTERPGTAMHTGGGPVTGEAARRSRPAMRGRAR